ncbi:Hpt domain-containing protein [bacterium]|nr:Hpt domain-containing protein [bacterium]
MLTIETLQNFGANTQEGLGRCMNNQNFYFRLVKMAAGDKGFARLSNALNNRDWNDAFEAAHGLKGILSNLALTPLVEPVSQLTELLRDKKEITFSDLLQQIEEKHKQLLELCG